MSRDSDPSAARADSAASRHAAGSDTRDRIVRAARALFAEKGFPTTSVAEIVRRAGVAQGTFYLYFPTKADVLRAFADDMREEMSTAVAPIFREEKPLRDLIEPLVRTAFEVAGRYRDVLGMAEAEALLRRDMTTHRERFAARAALWESIIRRDQAAGSIDASLDPHTTARLIVGVLLRAASDCFLEGTDIPTDRYATGVIDFLRRALGGPAEAGEQPDS